VRYRRPGAELLFEIFSSDMSAGQPVVTSNLPFDECTTVFSSERLTGALSIGSPTTSFNRLTASTSAAWTHATAYADVVCGIGLTVVWRHWLNDGGGFSSQSVMTLAHAGAGMPTDNPNSAHPPRNDRPYRGGG